MTPELRPIAAQFALDTDLLLNATEGLDDREANRRVIAGVNPIAFLVAHLTDARHFLIRLVGHHSDNPLAAHLGNARTADDVLDLPPLERLREHWRDVSTRLAHVLEDVGPAELAVLAPTPFLAEDHTVLGALTFLAQHDAYHLGQVAMLRRALGHPAMTYDRRHA